MDMNALAEALESIAYQYEDEQLRRVGESIELGVARSLVKLARKQIKVGYGSSMFGDDMDFWEGYENVKPEPKKWFRERKPFVADKTVTRMDPNPARNFQADPPKAPGWTKRFFTALSKKLKNIPWKYKGPGGALLAAGTSYKLLDWITKRKPMRGYAGDLQKVVKLPYYGR